MENLRKVGYDQNDQPPKNYIGYKNGQYLEGNGSKGVSSKGLNGGENSDNVISKYTVNSLEEIEDPKEGDIAIIPDSWGELTIEPTVTEDNGTITKVYNVESYSANSRIRVTSDPTCFASSYIDSENNSHNSGSVSTNVFPVGTKSITLGETGEFPEVRFYEEVTGATKEYVNGEGVDRANFSSAIENMSSEEKMGVRKNLGLYYEENNVEGEKIAKWTNEELVNNWAKISDDTPAKEDLIKLVVTGTGSDEDGEYCPPFTKDIEGGYYIGTPNETIEINVLFKVITEGADKGIYVGFSIQMIQLRGGDAILYYKGKTDIIHKIPEKYIPKQYATLLSIPKQEGIISNEDIEAIISIEDLKRILNGETNIAITYNGITFLCLVRKINMAINRISFIGLKEYNNVNYIRRQIIDGFEIQIVGDFASLFVQLYNLGDVFYTDINLPTGNETEEQIAQYFPSTFFDAALKGYINNICFNNNYTVAIISASYNRIEFWSSTDIYVVTPTEITVTPR